MGNTLDNSIYRISKKYIGAKIDIVLLLIAVSLTLLPLYSLGYLLLCVYGARRLHLVKSLNTYFAKFVLTFLLLISSIMIAGVFTSYLKIPNLPIINFVCTLFFIFVLFLLQPKQNLSKDKLKLFDTADIAALCAVLLVPLASVIMVVSSIGFSGLVYRQAAAGSWDGVQHFSFLQVNSRNNNYIFDTSPITVDGEKISNNYPQGWHLASSDIANGLFPGIFATETNGMKIGLLAYAAVVFAWFFLVLYLLIKFVNHRLPSQKSAIVRAVLLIIAAQFVVVTLLEPMWSAGFVNYIGILVFIMLAVMYSYELLVSKDSDSLLAYIAISAIMTAAVGLVWVLPVVFLVMLSGLVLITTYKVKFNPPKLVLALTVVLISVLSFVLYVRLLAASIDGEKFLFVTPGWLSQFPTVTTGFICCVVAALIALKLRVDVSKYVYILGAFLLPLSALYFISYQKINNVGYYQVKFYGIVFLVISTFMITALIMATENIKESTRPLLNNLLIIGVLVSGLGAIFIFSGQSMNIKMLSKGPTYTSPIEEKMLINFAYSTANPKTQAVVLNKDMVATDTNGSGLFNRRTSTESAKFISVKNLQNRPDTCLVYIFFDLNSGFTSASSQDTVPSYNRLNDCLMIRADQGYSTIIYAPESIRESLGSVNLHGASVQYF